MSPTTSTPVLRISVVIAVASRHSLYGVPEIAPAIRSPHSRIHRSLLQARGAPSMAPSGARLGRLGHVMILPGTRAPGRRLGGRSDGHPSHSFTAPRMPSSVELGLDTFGDVTNDSHGTPRHSAQVI